MKSLFIAVLLAIIRRPMGSAAAPTEGVDALEAAHQKARQRTENEMAVWEERVNAVNSCMLAPDDDDRAAALRVVEALRAELKTRETLLAVEREVVGAGGPATRPIHNARPSNDLTAESSYADRMLGILQGHLNGVQPQAERLSALGAAWRTAAAGNQEKIARIDRWMELVNREPALVERALDLYRERMQPGWYDRANLVAKYDLPALQLEVQAARAAVADGADPLAVAQLQAALAVLDAGKTTTRAIGEFNARMTRETPPVEYVFKDDPSISGTIWDMRALARTPAFRWLDEEGPVRLLLYRGEAYQGKPTDVFAYYATPGTLAGNPALDDDLPALALAHGGGDRAFRDWVTFWAKQGYAAVAMDLAGCGPNLKGEYDKLFKPERLLRGGPGQDGRRKILDINLPVTDQWPYHAVANVILSHSLLRSLPGVDPERTAVAGISWGGYVTCIAAGIDTRFKAAMPFYGCGFLTENSAWKDMGLFDQLTEPQRRRWAELWDASRYAGKINIPLFALTGAKDFAYPLESFARTYASPQGPRYFRITPDMGHGAQFMTRTPEAVVFMDSVLRGGDPLPTLRNPRIGANAVAVEVVGGQIITAQFHCTAAAGPNKTREWKSIEATVNGNVVSASRPPPSIAIGYFTAIDRPGHTWSSAPVGMEQGDGRKQ